MRSQALAIESYLSLCRTPSSHVEATGIPAIWFVATSMGSASVPTQPLPKPARVFLYPTIDRGMIRLVCQVHLSTGQGHAGCEGIAECTARTEEPAAMSCATKARQRNRYRLKRKTSGPTVTTRRVKRPETRLRPIRKASIPAEVTLPNWRHQT